jgi:perosamine synthetase
MNIPVTKPFLDEKEEAAVKEVIKSGWLSMGPKVAEFEKHVASYVSAKQGIAVSNCTTALHLCLELLGIGAGDEVIVPSLSFIATANSVMYTKAKPVFADVDAKTYNIDPSKIERLITKKTKAIMPVHQIGLPADMDYITEIANKHDVQIIEDAACGMGSEYKSRKIGGISKLTCFSFHARKLITTGDGGMITTTSDELAEKARIMRSHGASVSDLTRHSASKLVFEEYPCLGYNYRMTDMQGAVGIEQFKKLSFILSKRRELAKRYDSILSEIGSIITPHVPSYAKPTYQSYMIRIKGFNKAKRDELLQKLYKDGISARRGIMAIHMEPYYKRAFGKISLPVTEEVTNSSIILPLYPKMTEEEQDFVVERLKSHLA